MNHYQKFEKAVQGMEIPQSRKTASVPNALWFIRNGVAFNKEHPKVLSAIYHAQKIN